MNRRPMQVYMHTAVQQTQMSVTGSSQAMVYGGYKAKEVELQVMVEVNGNAVVGSRGCREVAAELQWKSSL